jgi:hypothetical protein
MHKIAGVGAALTCAYFHCMGDDKRETDDRLEVLIMVLIIVAAAATAVLLLISTNFSF